MAPGAPLPRYVVSISGPGNPVWLGNPDQWRIRKIINAVSMPDSRGRQYFTNRHGSQQKLRGKFDYDELNYCLDR